MKNEEFENLAECEGFDLHQWTPGCYSDEKTAGAFEGYQMRQPEIDALKTRAAHHRDSHLAALEENVTLKAEITMLDAAYGASLAQRDTLQAEVEKLRKDAERFGILLREFMYCEVHSNEEIEEGAELIKRYRAMKETK